MTARSQQRMRDRVLRWESIIRDDSAMYSQLAYGVAADPALLELIEGVRPGQLEMNMLLGAVQYLLLAEPNAPLARWYPSLGGGLVDGDLVGEFTTFVLANRETIAELIATRRVQTNEVARCTFLLPAYNLVNRLSGLPLALIEVGTSAGLNQNVDRYGYRYTSTSGTIELAAESPVHLSCSTGARVPEVAMSIPQIAWRHGIDIHPVDVTDADQARWLRALVWPDQVERHQRLAAALEVAQAHPPSVVGGDAFDAVPELVAAAPADTAIVIQHSFVLNQFPAPDRDRFYELLDQLAADRPLYRVGAELLQRDRPTVLDLTEHGDPRQTRELAEVHHHGTWIEWYDG